MRFPSKKQILTVLALLLSATSLSACGCGPLGLAWCGRGGERGGGYEGSRGPGRY